MKKYRNPLQAAAMGCAALLFALPSPAPLAAQTGQDTTGSAAASAQSTQPDTSATTKTHHRKHHRASAADQANAADPSAASTGKAADNTAHNKNHARTADQQTNAAGDRDTTKQIRQAVVSDKALSTYAHNVKIITTNGVVTLKGPVRTEEEKQSIADKATQVAGAGKVKNQLTVTPKS